MALFCSKASVPDKNVGSWVNPKLPGTSLWGGGVRCRARPTQFERKESVGTQQRWGRHDKGQRRTHLGHDAGGSVANRVRR